MTHLLVAGGGVAGLTAAIALAQREIAVTVAERRTAFGEVGAGIQIGPNATRCLEQLGLLDQVRRFATIPEEIRIRRSDTGARIAVLPLGASGLQRFGAPFFLVHRADLQRALTEAAYVQPNLDIILGTPVGAVADNGHISAELGAEPAERRRIAADGFVDGRGLHTAGTDRKDGSADLVFSGRVAWRTLVPAEAVASHFRQPASNLWLGPSAHLVHYPLRAGSTINVVVVVEDRDPSLGAADPWSIEGDPAILQHALRGWSDDVVSLVAAAPQWRRWPLFERPGQWRWSRGRSTVIGDAAHPMLPFLAQGASQAIEDGLALGVAVAADPENIPRAFRTFESVRAPRAARVVAASRQQGRVYHLTGIAARARDTGMRLLGPDRLLARMEWLYAPSADLHRDTL